jgi:hypothetical protein
MFHVSFCLIERTLRVLSLSSSFCVALLFLLQQGQRGNDVTKEPNCPSFFQLFVEKMIQGSSSKFKVERSYKFVRVPNDKTLLLNTFDISKYCLQTCLASSYGVYRKARCRKVDS